MQDVNSATNVHHNLQGAVIPSSGSVGMRIQYPFLCCQGAGCFICSDMYFVHFHPLKLIEHFWLEDWGLHNFWLKMLDLWQCTMYISFLGPKFTMHQWCLSHGFLSVFVFKVAFWHFNCWHISNYVIQYETLVEASDFWRMIPVAISYPSLCIQKNVILCIQFGINWLWLLHSAFHVRNSFVHFLTS